MTWFGYDISHWQDDFDHQQAYREGLRFCYAKVTEHDDFKDDKWPRNRDLAQEAGIKIAGYHFLRGDYPEEAQADNLASWLGDDEIPVIIDCEKREDDEQQIFSYPTIGTVRRFREACRERSVRVSMLYLPRWYWQERFGAGLSKLPPLINSNYGTEPLGGPASVYETVGGDEAAPWSPYGGQTPSIWQFSRKAMVAGQRVDVNAYRGSLTDLDRWFKPSDPPKEEVGMELSDVLNQKAVDEDGADPYRVRRALLDVRDVKADVLAHEQHMIQMEAGFEIRITELKEAIRGAESRLVQEIRNRPAGSDVDPQEVAQAVLDAFFGLKPGEPSPLPEPVMPRNMDGHGKETPVGAGAKK